MKELQQVEQYRVSKTPPHLKFGATSKFDIWRKVDKRQNLKSNWSNQEILLALAAWCLMMFLLLRYLRTLQRPNFHRTQSDVKRIAVYHHGDKNRVRL